MQPRRSRWTLLAGGAVRSGVFEEILLPHLDSLYSLALRLTRDPDVAADLLQDTALRAFQRFHQLRQPQAARSWLVKILGTTFLNRYSRRDSPDALTSDTEPVSDETPEAALLRRCDAEEVEAALAELREEFRLTVLLADVEELPLREIALICGCPVGTVASRLARARQQLRRRLRHLRRAGEAEA